MPINGLPALWVPDRHGPEQKSGKPQAQGQLRQPVQAMIDRADLVDDFFNVPGEILSPGVSFALQHILERALGPFDLRTEHSFPTNVHAHEKVRVGQDRGDPIQPAQSSVSFRK